MRDRRHIAEETLVRLWDIPVTVEIVWRYDGGIHLEPGHSRNGYARGWWCYKIEAHEIRDGERIELREAEIDEFLERYHPDNLPEDEE